MTTAFLLFAATLFGGDEPKPAPARVTPTVAVTCKAEAVVRGAEILLGDVAEITAVDAALADRIAALSLGKRPSLQINRVMAQREVLDRLTAEGLTPAELRIGGAREIVVHSPVARVQPQEIVDAAEPVLRAILEREDSDVEFQLAQQLRQTLVPPGRRSLDLKANLRAGTLNLRSAVVEVTVLVDDEAFVVVPVQFALRRYSHVLVTTRVVRRGEPLDQSNVELRRVDAGTGANPYLGDLDALHGKVAARDLRGEERLTLSTLSNPAVVRRGDPVTLVSTRGRIKITTRAVAQSDAAVGDRVVVTALSSGKPIQAIVEAAGIVIVP